jgi:hypothetical protein
VIGVPVFIVAFALVVRVGVGFLVERVLDAFVEDLFGVLWSVRAFCLGNSVMEAKIVEERWEIVWMIFDIELFIKKVLNLLFLPGLSLTEAFNELFLVGLVELRGPAVPEVRG